jgi:Family of unknown function (DUF6235)
MNATPAPASGRQAAYTITAGLDLLAGWAADATDAQKNIIYRILFAVADHTAAAQYNTLDDAASPAEYFVMGKAGLVVKIHAQAPDSFAITYIGTSEDAPGLDAACAAAATQALHAIHASTPQA